jgi:hypothetical protein
MLNQSATRIIMIRPRAFGFNPETASSNAFQKAHDEAPTHIQQKAVEEFNRMVDLLESHDIDVRVFDDTTSKPDAVFPNNWISFHDDGKVILYPMQAESRRGERRMDIPEKLKLDFQIQEVVDFSEAEKSGRFLEGTGSMVFDYINRIAYACRSPRTDETLVREICALLQVKPLMFDAVDAHGKAIYHTNVMLCIGTKFTVVCLDAIRSENDQDIILNSLAETEHKVVAISYAQMKAFAGNMLEVRSRKGEPYVVLSDRAFNSLLPGQIDAITRFVDMIPVSIETIENYGGGSVRCMMAANYLPLHSGLSQ